MTGVDDEVVDLCRDLIRIDSVNYGDGSGAGERKAAWKEIQSIWNEQGWFVWLPILNVKVPVSDRFGNVQPSVMAHRILWNIERVYVK